MRQMRIQGASGGSGGSSGGNESPDNLHSTSTARILDILSEGPIVGLVNGLQSVFLDGTPIQNSDGSFNFQNYGLDTRLGTVDQAYLPGFPSVENEIGIGVALTSDAPWVRQVTNTALSAVRIRFGVPSLEETKTDTGDIVGYKVQYAIDLAVDGGSYSQVATGAFDGKTTSLYERSIRIELPKAQAGWLVRVRRLTANAHNSYIQDTVNIEAITEVVDRKLRYPNTALVGITFDAKSFSSVPTRGYLVRGRIVAVPSNYDPDTRTYTGVWDGTFKQAWTNCPAWVFYDLARNTRYGGGRYIDASALDKWTLYAIGQYCDEQVDNGQGGTEPRFTCNVVIQSQADAFKVLQDLASIFNGQSYWGAGSVLVTADMPQDPVYVYNQANVIGGKFTYSGSERKSRYTVAQVSWNNPENQYKAEVEYAQDDTGLKRYGMIKASVTAFGCTSQAEAHRRALWILTTSRLETEPVSFSVGLDGQLAPPGSIIAVADPRKAGRRMGGRIRGMSADRKVVTVDKFPVLTTGNVLTVIMPDGVAQKRTVSSGNVDTGELTVSESFDSVAVGGAVWMLESDDLVAQLFSVTGVDEQTDNGQITYAITAVQHEPGKFAYIDSNVKIQKRPTTVIPPRAQVAPASVSITSHVVIDQGIARTTMTIGWEQAANAVTYGVEWRKDGGNWVTAGSALSGLSVDVQGVYTGAYEARVYATNVLGVSSLSTSSGIVQIAGKDGAPPTVASLTASTDQIFQIELDWGFPADNTAADTAYTEILYSRTPDPSTATTQGIYAYPTDKAMLMGLAAGQAFFFWARLTDRSGNRGALYPSGAGVQGMSTMDAAPILKQIAGALTESELGQELLGPIQAVSALQGSAADAAQSIADIRDQIGQVQTTTQVNQSAITDLQNSVSGLTGLDFTQLKEDLDELKGADLTGLLTDVGALKDQIFPRLAGDDGEYAGDDFSYAGVITEQSMREEADLALATRVDGVVAQVSTAQAQSMAYVDQESAARAAADVSMAQTVTALQARFDTLTSNTNAQIAEEQTARADADSAMATDIENLQATVTTNAAAAAALVTQEQAARVTADQATAQQIASLQATMTTADSANAASIATETKARADADTANSTAITALSATVTGNKTAADAALTAEASARASADTAITQSVTQLKATVDGNTSAITALATTTSNATSALADQVDSINATLSAEPMAGDDSGLAGSDSVMAGIASENSARVDAQLALTQQVESMQAQLRAAGNATASSVTQETINRAAQNQALSDSLTQMGSAMTTANAQLSAQITQESQTRADADSAQAQQITTLTATMKSADTALGAQITDEQTARVDADGALAQSVTDLQAAMTKGDSDLSARVTTETSARVTADAATADAITALTAAMTTADTATQALVTQETAARAAADSANAKAITDLQATVNTTIAAEIASEAEARATADQANASAITTLQTTVGQNSAAIQTNAQSYADLSGKVNASYTIKVQTSAGGWKYAAGMTLGSNGQTSTIAFSANQFIVVDPNGGTASSPFAIINGQVFLNDAFIQRASITNVVVGSTLQSARTGANGRPMIVVDFANGNFEINSPNYGGGWLTFNGQTLQAFDGNGVLRVRCGLW